MYDSASLYSCSIALKTINIDQEGTYYLIWKKGRRFSQTSKCLFSHTLHNINEQLQLHLKIYKRQGQKLRKTTHLYLMNQANQQVCRFVLPVEQWSQEKQLLKLNILNENNLRIGQITAEVQSKLLLKLQNFQNQIGDVDESEQTEENSMKAEIYKTQQQQSLYLQIVELRRANEDLQYMCDKLVNDRNLYSAKADSVQRQITIIKKNINIQLQKLLEYNEKRMNIHKSVYLQQIQSLVDSFNQNYYMMNKSFREIIEEKDSLEERLSDKEEQLRKNVIDIRILEQKTREQNDECNKLSEKLLETEVQNSKSRKQLLSKQQQHEIQINALCQQLKNSQETIKYLQIQLNQKNNRVQTLEYQSDKLNRNLIQKQANLLEIQQKNSCSMLKIEQFLTQKDYLTAQNQVLANSNIQLKQMCSQLSDKISKLQTIYDRDQQNANALLLQEIKKNEIKYIQNQQLQMNVQTLTNTVRILQEQLEKITSEFYKCNQQLQTAQISIIDNQNLIQQLKEDKYLLQKNNEEMCKQSQDFIWEFHKLSEFYMKEISQISGLYEQLDQMRKRIYNENYSEQYSEIIYKQQSKIAKMKNFLVMKLTIIQNDFRNKLNNKDRLQLISNNDETNSLDKDYSNTSQKQKLSEKVSMSVLEIKRKQSEIQFLIQNNQQLKQKCQYYKQQQFQMEQILINHTQQLQRLNQLNNQLKKQLKSYNIMNNQIKGIKKNYRKQKRKFDKAIEQQITELQNSRKKYQLQQCDNLDEGSEKTAHFRDNQVDNSMNTKIQKIQSSAKQDLMVIPMMKASWQSENEQYDQQLGIFGVYQLLVQPQKKHHIAQLRIFNEQIAIHYKPILKSTQQRGVQKKQIYMSMVSQIYSFQNSWVQFEQKVQKNCIVQVMVIQQKNRIVEQLQKENKLIEQQIIDKQIQEQHNVHKLLQQQYKVLEKQYKQSNEIVKNLESRIDQLQKMNQQQQHRNNEIQNELRQKIKNIQNEVWTKQQQKLGILQKMRNKLSQVEDSKYEISVKNSKSKLQVQQLCMKIKSLQCELKQANQQVKGYKKSRLQLIQKIDKLDAQKNKSQKQLAQLTKHLSQMNIKNQEKGQLLEKATAKLQETILQNQSYKQQQKKYQDSQKQLQNKYKLSQEMCTDLSQQIQKHLLQIQQLTQQYIHSQQIIKQQSGIHKKQYQHHQQLISKYQSQVQKMDNILTQLNNQIKHIAEQYSKLESQLNYKYTQCQYYQCQLIQFQQKLQQINQQFDQQRQQYTKQAERYKKNIQSAQNSAKKYQNRNKTLQLRNQDLQGLNQKYAYQLKMIKNKLQMHENSNNQHIALKQHIKHLQQQNQQVARELLTIKRDYERCRYNNTNQKKQYHERMERQKQKYEQQVQNRIQQIKQQYSNKIQTMQRQIIENHSEYLKSGHNNAQLQQNISQLSLKLRNAQKQNKQLQQSIIKYQQFVQQYKRLHQKHLINQSQVINMINRINQIQNQNESIKNQYRMLEQLFKSTNQQHNKQLNYHQQLSTSNCKQNLRLRQDIQSLRKLNNQLQSNKLVLSQNILAKQLENQRINARQQNIRDQYIIQINNLNKKVLLLQQEQQQALIAQSQYIRKQLADRDCLIDHLNKRILSKDQQIKQLQKQINSLKSLINQQRAQFDELGMKIQALTAQLKKQKQQYQQMNQVMQISHNETVKQLENEITKLTQKLLIERRDKAQQQMITDDRIDRSKVLQTKLSRKQQQISVLKFQIEALELTLTKSQVKTDTSQRRVPSNQRQLGHTTIQKQLKLKINEGLVRQQLLKLKNQALLLENNHFQEELTNLKAFFDRIHNDIENRRATIHQQQGQQKVWEKIKQIINEHQSQELQIDQLKKQISEKDKKLNIKHNDLVLLQKLNAQKGEQNKDISRKNEELFIMLENQTEKVKKLKEENQTIVKRFIQCKQKCKNNERLLSESLSETIQIQAQNHHLKLRLTSAEQIVQQLQQKQLQNKKKYNQILQNYEQIHLQKEQLKLQTQVWKSRIDHLTKNKYQLQVLQQEQYMDLQKIRQMEELVRLFEKQKKKSMKKMVSIQNLLLQLHRESKEQERQKIQLILNFIETQQ